MIRGRFRWRSLLRRFTTGPEEAALAGKPLFGGCPVCGRSGVRFHPFAANLRESGACSSCGASNRQRQTALVLRRELRLRPLGRLVLPAQLSVYSAEANGALYAALADAPGYICSEYFRSDYVSGSIINGIRHEDLQRLSFDDASFDAVLSSDVLEHMPDAYRAHQEIFRVLRHGGRHIFTVPFRGAPDDDIRARQTQDGIEYLAEPLYHGDPVRPGEGVLVWRIFGEEMFSHLQDIGFAVTIVRLYEPRFGIIGDNALVFIARKP